MCEGGWWIGVVIWHLWREDVIDASEDLGDLERMSMHSRTHERSVVVCAWEGEWIGLESGKSEGRKEKRERKERKGKDKRQEHEGCESTVVWLFPFCCNPRV